MLRTTRWAAFLLLSTAALFTAGCGKSNNEGKIVGKWKIVSVTGAEAAMLEELAADNIYAYIEFFPDKTAVIGVVSDDPQVQKELVETGMPITFRCKYKLRSGDGLEMYDLPKEMQDGGGFFGRNKDRARTNAKIDGDTMTMTDEDGQVTTWVRVGPKPVQPGAGTAK